MPAHACRSPVQWHRVFVLGRADELMRVVANLVERVRHAATSVHVAAEADGPEVT